MSAGDHPYWNDIIVSAQVHDGSTWEPSISGGSTMWQCPRCKGWYASGVWHDCAVTGGYPSIPSNYDPQLQRIIDLLERIAKALEAQK